MVGIVCFYVTGHGYGHATRVIGQVSFLLEKGYTIHIVSSLDPNFFLSNIDSSINLFCHRRVLDAGAVQIDPLHIDIEKTLTNYYEQIHMNHDILLEQEIKFLTENKIQLVLVDVTPLPLSAAKACGIKSVIVSNFTWDVTYEFLVDIIQSKLKSKDDELIKFAKFREMVSQCNLDVCNADVYLRLPGITPLPKNYNGKVIPGPMICRKAKTSREIIRSKLKISNEAHVVVLGFGGFKLSSSWSLRDDMLPNNWICVVLASEGESFPSSRFIPISKDAYVPDIIAASDAVLGKLGYGTVSECLCHGIPLLFVPRSDWPEEEYLSSFILHYNAGIRTSEADFLAGHWECYLQQALQKKGPFALDELHLETAFERVENVFKELLPE